MKKNMGPLDQFVRVAVGLVILALIFVLEGNARWWGMVGLVPLLTGLFGVCPVYSIFGISTCETKSSGHAPSH